jgi:hypothetical protein
MNVYPGYTEPQLMARTMATEPSSHRRGTASPRIAKKKSKKTITNPRLSFAATWELSSCRTRYNFTSNDVYRSEPLLTDTRTADKTRRAETRSRTRGETVWRRIMRRHSRCSTHPLSRDVASGWCTLASATVPALEEFRWMKHAVASWLI